MATARNVASYFIERSDESNESDLTNLKIQKLLYFAQAEHLQAFHKPLFEEVVEAWKYGPVVRDVYNWLKSCGAYPVTSFDIESDFGNLTEEEKKFLDGIWDKYNKYSASYLVSRTHMEGSPWADVYMDGAGENQIIPIDKLASMDLTA